MMTICPSGRASCALDEADSPTSPAGWLLMNSAMQGAFASLAAPKADGAVTAMTTDDAGRRAEGQSG